MAGGKLLLRQRVKADQCTYVLVTPDISMLISRPVQGGSKTASVLIVRIS